VDKLKVIHRLSTGLSTYLSTGQKVIHIVIHRGCGQNVDNFYAMNPDTKKPQNHSFLGKTDVK
jgi:hypothetical protein